MPLHRKYSQCTTDPYVTIWFYRMKSIESDGNKKKDNKKAQKRKST